nr:NBS-LRR type disease resistance protein [Ipomoea batatas]
MEKDFRTFSESIPDGGSIMEKAQKATKVQHLERMAERVEKLRDEGRNIGELTVSLSSRAYPLIVDPLSGRTSQSNLEEIYRWLEDENVRIIGVYRMGGVGKTTLAKHIYNQMLKNESHVNVYWVTVSQDFNIRKLQDDIIRTVGVTIFEENEEQRAAILRNHLVEKNAVLVLDDVWDNIHLEKLGVPLRVKGCKLILTTRSLDVCRRIGCQKLFKVNVLNEEEGWNLFKEIFLQDDQIVLTHTIENHAKELAKKCGGLPLALNTVAASMRGVNDDHIWRNAIKNFQNASLQMEDLENNVFEILKFSYKRLTDPSLKECFLYCCLYPEDYHIDKDEIIMKLIAKRLCEDIDEGHSILKKLVDVFLLEGGEFLVNMHDLMREMALKISKFMVKSELVEIPEEKHWTAELERVSLSSSYNNELECLPNSISNLENLCGLFLQGCSSISCLPAMKKMKKLRVLNIEGCKGIRELPQDMECLVSLQYLYMRGTSTDLEIPKGVISKLRNLKCIQSVNCRRLQSEDLNCLPHLQEFWSWFDELHNFNRLVKNLEQLKCYYILVGSSNIYWRALPLGSSKKVDFTGINFTLVLLPANITCLSIADCEGLNGCIADYLQSIMSNLKKLDVWQCTEVEWILNSEQIIENASNTGATPFKSLEKLTLLSLSNLISVCKGEDVILPDYCTFSSLKHLSIVRCESMKKLLPHALLQNLKNLEKLYVGYCSQLEVVIGGVEGDGEEEDTGMLALQTCLNSYKSQSPDITYAVNLLSQSSLSPVICIGKLRLGLNKSTILANPKKQTTIITNPLREAEISCPMRQMQQVKSLGFNYFLSELAYTSITLAQLHCDNSSVSLPHCHNPVFIERTKTCGNRLSFRSERKSTTGTLRTTYFVPSNQQLANHIYEEPPSSKTIRRHHFQAHVPPLELEGECVEEYLLIVNYV